MSHHGHEDAMERWNTECDRERLPGLEAKLASAVELIDAIAKGFVMDPDRTCDTWLENNGYDCKAKRHERTAARAAELDAQIAKLQAERGRL